METTLSESELATGLREALERVRDGTRIIVERDGRPIALIVPAGTRFGITWRELAEALREVPSLDDGFGHDLASIRAAQSLVRLPEWPD